jgi:hypothetical protein
MKRRGFAEKHVPRIDREKPLAKRYPGRYARWVEVGRYVASPRWKGWVMCRQAFASNCVRLFRRYQSVILKPPEARVSYPVGMGESDI